jgi:hypothetical protein
VHAALKLDAEVKGLGFTSSPDILSLLLHNLAIHHGEATEAEVGW